MKIKKVIFFVVLILGITLGEAYYFNKSKNDIVIKALAINANSRVTNLATNIRVLDYVENGDGGHDRMVRQILYTSIVTDLVNITKMNLPKERYTPQSLDNICDILKALESTEFVAILGEQQINLVRTYFIDKAGDCSEKSSGHHLPWE